MIFDREPNDLQFVKDNYTGVFFKFWSTQPTKPFKLVGCKGRQGATLCQDGDSKVVPPLGMKQDVQGQLIL